MLLRRLILALPLILTHLSFSQSTETFDIATYSVPIGWKKISNTAEISAFAITNDQKGTYCQAAFYKSMNTMGNPLLDFDTEWRDLVAKPYKISLLPDAGPVKSDDGWEIRSGSAPFEFGGSQSIAMLITMSGYGKRMSVVILTNTPDYQTELDALLLSLKLKKPDGNFPQTTTPPDVASLIGIWGKGSSLHEASGIFGYSKDQYTFNNDGTYSFFTRSFRSTFDKILLVKETGTYQIAGNSLTIIPEKSVIETWTKKDGVDKYGKLLSTQNRSLEKVTYQFTHHYFSGIQEWNLVLQSPKATARDGGFSSNTTFTNAWYYARPTANSPVIELP